MKVAGAVCLVTGGARGLGRGFAEGLLKAGAKVCVTDILEDVLNNTVSELRAQFDHESIIGVTADVTSQQQMEAAFDQATRDLGQLDIVINCAGVPGLGDPGPVYDINLYGAIRGTDLAVARMRGDKGGRGGVIVNISSPLGIYCAGMVPNYVASKHGILGYTRSLALEMGADVGISFRVLCPGPVQTNLLEEYLKASGGADFEQLVTPEGFGPEHKIIMTAEIVVKACMMCIERDDLEQGAVIKALSTGIYQVFPEKAPCEKLA